MYKQLASEVMRGEEHTGTASVFTYWQITLGIVNYHWYRGGRKMLPQHPKTL